MQGTTIVANGPDVNLTTNTTTATPNTSKTDCLYFEQCHRNFPNSKNCFPKLVEKIKITFKILLTIIITFVQFALLFVVSYSEIIALIGVGCFL